MAVRFRPSVIDRTPRVRDEETQRALTQHADAILDFGDRAILNGRLVEDVTITSGQRAVVLHRLGRAPNGYLIAKRNANAVVYDETPQRPQDELWLQASANVTVSLWVF